MDERPETQLPIIQEVAELSCCHVAATRNHKGPTSLEQGANDGVVDVLVSATHAQPVLRVDRHQVDFTELPKADPRPGCPSWHQPLIDLNSFHELLGQDGHPG